MHLRFDISRTVRQGFGALPWLFNLFMDSRLYDLKEDERGSRTDEPSVKCLLYTDDQDRISSNLRVIDVIRAREICEDLNYVEMLILPDGLCLPFCLVEGKSPPPSHIRDDNDSIRFDYL
ncbi:hypothetical protein EVAR_20368_1 [Eumeta japonica]|uniref:Reverse transcriptase domain-containing protein n=1 Tax=Eumeta variegata TaxID=151549 RepID=A0A4C1VSR3_EUMVA|nr:hypothetical protein EVAR_20368_1 [Eumeta japonica]